MKSGGLKYLLGKRKDKHTRGRINNLLNFTSEKVIKFFGGVYGQLGTERAEQDWVNQIQLLFTVFCFSGKSFVHLAQVHRVPNILW